MESQGRFLSIARLLLGVMLWAVGCGGGDGAPGSARLPLGHDHGENGSDGWEPRGPGGGGALFSPAINPHDGEELFMASDLTAVFHSRDFGRSWRTLNHTILEGSVLAQFRFTASPHILYATNFAPPPGSVAFARRLAKSTNGGLTWDAPVTSPGVAGLGHYLFVDPRSTRRLLFSDPSALFYSEDGGATFRSVYTTTWPDGLLVGGAYWDGHDIYVGTSDGLLVSHDNGASFALDTSLSGIPAGEKMVSFAGSRHGRTTRFFAVTFAATDSDGNSLVTADTTGGDLDAYAGTYRLTLGETAWVPATTGFGPSDKLSFVAMSLGNPAVAYAAGGNRDKLAPIVMKTSNGGASWQSVFRTDHNANIATGWSGFEGDIDWEFGEFAEGLAVSLTDPDRVVVTDLGFVHVTDSGGVAWRQAYLNQADQNRPGADTPRSRFYRSNGVEQTSAWWLTWSDWHTIFASLTDIRSAFSRDGGRSWARDGNNGLSLNTTYHVVRHPRTGALYAATSRIHDIYQSPYLRDSRLDVPDEGGVMVSTDKGATWTPLVSFQRPVIWLALDPRDPNQLYASVINSVTGGIYHVDLGRAGDPPTRLPTPPRTQGHPFNVHVLNDGSLVATYSGHQPGATRTFTDRSGVFVLPPGATAWEDRSAPEMQYWTKDLVLDPNDPTQSTWYVAVFSHDTRLFGGLYRTRDRGLTWQRIATKYRVESCTVDPLHPNRMYMTTQLDGLWVTHNLRDATPTFVPVADYPFQQPVRVFFNPFAPWGVWVTSFGAGIRVKAGL